jgi:prepilin-type N-terminal cleavage/methylation domain-containing protein
MGARAAARPAAQSGFTLVEILVAIVILSFVALGIAGLFSHSIKVNASGYDYALLATEARLALESLQALPFDDPSDNNDPLDASTSPKTWTPANPNFQIRYTVEDYYIDNWANVSAGNWQEPTGSLNANLKRITLTVESTNPVLGGRRMFTVTSLKIPG